MKNKEVMDSPGWSLYNAFLSTSFNLSKTKNSNCYFEQHIFWPTTKSFNENQGSTQNFYLTEGKILQVSC